MNKLFGVISCAFFLSFWQSSVAAETYELDCKVKRVIDGDTVVLDTEGKGLHVRLFGIDCPELKQPYGTQARDFVRSQIGGSPVHVSVRKVDKYKRALGIIDLSDGRCLNVNLVQYGFAWVYMSTNEGLKQTEREARARRIGLWADEHPQAPWEYRASKKKKKPLTVIESILTDYHNKKYSTGKDVFPPNPAIPIMVIDELAGVA